MSRIAQCALLFHLAASGATAAEPIGILFDFGNPPENSVVDLMKSEIRNILAPAQLELTFQRLDRVQQTSKFRKIVIVRFRGECQERGDWSQLELTASPMLDYPALGKTAISNGEVLPDVQIYCNEVRAFVPPVSRLPFAELYGRALGRVVVHELYHALLSTRDHTRGGVARFSQSARDLTRSKLSLDAESIGRLKALYGPRHTALLNEKEGGPSEPPSIGQYFPSELGP